MARSDWPHSVTGLPGAVVLRAVVLLVILAALAAPLSAYSVLTHEAIIDSAWNDGLQPLLLKRFPQTDSAGLVHAHAHAYAGCILQDMGYYPFGSRFFSDLVHYVRSGDFVVNLIRDSQDVNEYAFALGALAHYAGDTQGHFIAVNRAVALQYPDLARRFGDRVTYADKPAAHLQVEFAFDVLQVSRGNYAPVAYHDFVGFEVARPVLERAFRDTYSLELSSLFKDLELSLGTYRHAVSRVIPAMTQVAWRLKRDELTAVRPTVTRRRFVYNLSRSSYRKEWGRAYREPGVGTRILAFVVRLLPKVGPLRALDFRPPTPQTDALFQASFDTTLDHYRGLLAQLRDDPGMALENRDFDTGAATRPGEYVLADAAYSTLAVALAARNAADVAPSTRADVLAFYRDLSLPYATKSSPSAWSATLAALDKLKAQER